jgi:hypothetical protein
MAIFNSYVKLPEGIIEPYGSGAMENTPLVIIW